MLIEAFIEFYLRKPGLTGSTCTPITGYFHDKTKIYSGKPSSGLLFTAKILHWVMCLNYFLYLGQINFTISTKIQHLKMR